MKPMALLPRPKFGSGASMHLFVVALCITFGIIAARAQNEPILVPDAVN